MRWKPKAFRKRFKEEIGATGESGEKKPCLVRDSGQ